MFDFLALEAFWLAPLRLAEVVEVVVVVERLVAFAAGAALEEARRTSLLALVERAVVAFAPLVDSAFDEEVDAWRVWARPAETVAALLDDLRAEVFAEERAAAVLFLVDTRVERVEAVELVALEEFWAEFLFDFEAEVIRI